MAFKINNQSSLTFTSDGNFDKFVEVRVDGTVVAPENYTVIRGSTILTLKREYIATLSIGTHTLDIVFANNDIASCSFECVNTYVPSIPSGGNTGGFVTTTTAPVTTPETTTTEATTETTKPADEVEDPEDIDDDTDEDDADISVDPDDTDDDTDDSTDGDVDNETSGETDENPFTGVVISFAGVAVSVAAVVMTKKRKQK